MKFPEEEAAKDVLKEEEKKDGDKKDKPHLSIGDVEDVDDLDLEEED
jgi:hypothetical protein